MFIKPKITFENLLSGMPARDYIFQDMSYEEQIRQAAGMIREADYVLLGAGAGMSTAAGAVYGGAWFSENLRNFSRSMEEDPICRICTAPVFIRIRMKSPFGATGLNRH